MKLIAILMLASAALSACGGDSNSNTISPTAPDTEARREFTPAQGVPTPPFGEIAVGNLIQDVLAGNITPINNYTWNPARQRTLQFVMRPSDLGEYGRQFGTALYGETVMPPDPNNTAEEPLLLFKMYWFDEPTPSFEARIYMRGRFCGREGWFLRALPIGSAPQLWAGGIVVGWPKFNLIADIDDQTETADSLRVRGFFPGLGDLFELTWTRNEPAFREAMAKDNYVAFHQAPGRMENDPWWWYSPVHLVGPDVRETYGFPDAMANGNASSRDGLITMRIAKSIPPALTLGAWPDLFPDEFTVPGSIVDIDNWGWTEYSGNCGLAGFSVINPPLQ